ncbi:FAD synthetase family protein [Bacillus sp. FJAT-50051]|uniref:FAD synthase n=1 Tax=Neobacillus citreus TaxID=2833578 RepID=A0A942YER3_9BACI|nr:FAD synthetase family protein [Neobacillus citreus]MCH6268518.1 FAD synthetase family protein [Neobacillus citreus]
MKVHTTRSLQLSKSVLAIGALDGVHRGHQVLIQRARSHANKLGVPLVVYTFDPPPKVFFKNLLLLTPLSEKINRLKSLGVDHVIVASFDFNYITRGVDAFLSEISDINPLAIYEGHDFKFGKNREGDINTLRERFSVTVIEPVCCNTGIVISSSRIRNLLVQGSFLQAEQLLGWSLPGTRAKSVFCMEF